MSAPPSFDDRTQRDQGDAARRARVGVAYGVAAYVWWGFAPLYFKAVAHVAALEVLAHRVIWSALLLAGLMRFYDRWPAAIRSLRSRRTVATLGGTTALIACNWYLFIWAVTHDRVLEASLGYFINPLLNVLFGVILLGERLRRWQIVSVAVAGIGVAHRTIELGEPPLLALAMATSFGLYGLLRKTASVDALTGLAVETATLLPAALACLIWLSTDDRMAFGSTSIGTSVLLAMGGIITAAPLLWFTNAARRLRLATLGFLQYIAPTFQFLLAVVVFREPFRPAQLVSFGCIWIALTIYSVDAATSKRPD